MMTQNKQTTEIENGEMKVKRALLAQLERIENLGLSEEQFNLEERRSKVIYGITGNLVKMSALSLKAVELKLRHHQLGLGGDVPRLDNFMG